MFAMQCLSVTATFTKRWSSPFCMPSVHATPRSPLSTKGKAEARSATTTTTTPTMTTTTTVNDVWCGGPGNWSWRNIVGATTQGQWNNHGGVLLNSPRANVHDRLFIQAAASVPIKREGRGAREGKENSHELRILIVGRWEVGRSVSRMVESVCIGKVGLSEGRSSVYMSVGRYQPGREWGSRIETKPHTPVPTQVSVWQRG